MMTTTMDLETQQVWKGLLCSWDVWFFSIVLTVILPIIGYIRFRQLAARGDRIVPLHAKLIFYARIVGVQWFLVLVMLLNVLDHHHVITPARSLTG